MLAVACGGASEGALPPCKHCANNSGKLLVCQNQGRVCRANTKGNGKTIRGAGGFAVIASQATSMAMRKQFDGPVTDLDRCGQCEPAFTTVSATLSGLHPHPWPKAHGQLSKAVRCTPTYMTKRRVSPAAGPTPKRSRLHPRSCRCKHEWVRIRAHRKAITSTETAEQQGRLARRVPQ